MLIRDEFKLKQERVITAVMVGEMNSLSCKGTKKTLCNISHRLTGTFITKALTENTARRQFGPFNITFQTSAYKPQPYANRHG